MKTDFRSPLSPGLINLDEKKRSNLLTWRGQFSPELIENLIHAYAEDNDVLLDPFCGSGTLLYEAGRLGFNALGVELNPAAYNLSRTYEFINISLKDRQEILSSFYKDIEKAFELPELFEIEEPKRFVGNEITEKLQKIADLLENKEYKILCNSLITILDFNGTEATNTEIQKNYLKLEKLIFELPYSNKSITVKNSDCRAMPYNDNSADFVITSPPYINVFNYHQNYRKSIELLGWEVLNIAKSEIGSNRANRSNRYLTVVQYVIDMALCLKEIQRCVKKEGKCLLIVGYESNVLGCRFYNSEIIEEIAKTIIGFTFLFKQQRTFINKFGKNIKEDIMHFTVNKEATLTDEEFSWKCGEIAEKHLLKARGQVSEKNAPLLDEAIIRASKFQGTKIYQGTL